MAEPTRCQRCARTVPWFSFWGNLLLAVYKLIVGFFGSSAALVADAMHSFADVVGSTGILVATKVSSRDPDERYPYGRGKAEFIGAVFVYTVLFFFAIGIIIGAIRSIVLGTEKAPHFVTLLASIVSVLYNLLMYKYATCVGRRNNSPAILADAFENRADAVSSFACIVGIGGAMLIHPICDPLAALVVGFVILWNCQEQLREAVRGLMDGGLSPEQIELIERISRSHDGVEDVAFVRTRQTGARYWVDLGLRVAGGLDVASADAIGDTVRADLQRRPDYHHVQVFVLPDGEPAQPARRARPRNRQPTAR